MEQTITKEPPFHGVQAFLRDFRRSFDATPDELALTRYRESQTTCEFCHMPFNTDCNSGACC